MVRHLHSEHQQSWGFFRLYIALDWLKIELNDNIFYFVYSIVLEKRDRKYFLVYIKVKEKPFGVEKCVLEKFLKLLKLKYMNRKSPFFIST